METFQIQKIKRLFESKPKAYNFTRLIKSKCAIIEPEIVTVSHRIALYCYEECDAAEKLRCTKVVIENKLDSLMIGSDSGTILILEYSTEKRKFFKSYEENFGKSACKRMIPGNFEKNSGQHFAMDPKGRAVMIAAIEKQKLIYQLSQKENKMILENPKEVQKCSSICVDVAALDVGNENPVFVCLEIDFGDISDKEALINIGGVRKSLIYYEVELKMRSILKRKEILVDPSANLLVTVPGGDSGPGGIIVLIEDGLLYKSNDHSSEKHVVFPKRRNGIENKKTLFTSYAVSRNKELFLLISSELGDLFKVVFEMSGGELTDIKVSYFETISCPTSIALTKNRHLFCASEKEDHQLYSLIERSSYKEKPFNNFDQKTSSHFDIIKDKNERELENTDFVENLGPVTDLKTFNFSENKSLQIYVLNSSSDKSYLRIIKQGIKVVEKKKVKCHTPLAMWSVKGTDNDEFMKLIILSFHNKTVVYSFENGAYVSATEPGLEIGVTSIHIGRLSDNSLVQITSSGFRHITKKNVRPIKIDGYILKGITKGSQMVLALQGGNIIYYELDSTGELMEVEQKMLDDEVVEMDLTPTEGNDTRSNFLVVGLRGKLIRVLDLDSQSLLRIVCEEKTKDLIESIIVDEMEFERNKRFYIYAGLSKGTIIRTVIDPKGIMQESTSYILGEGPIKCTKMLVENKSAILVLGDKPWLISAHNNKQIINQLSYPHLDMAVYANNQVYGNTICGYSEKFLVFFNLENYGKTFHSERVPLAHSGKKIIAVDKSLAILESERIVTENERIAKWNAQISIFSPNENKFTYHIRLDENETCTALTYCSVKEKEGIRKYLVLACSQSLTFLPKLSSEKNKIKIFEEKNDAFEFYHETDVEDICLALQVWDQKFLAGIGNCMRSYEIGRKKILRKAEVKNLNSFVNSISVSGKKIFVTELCDSFHMYTYKEKEQTFYDLADDILPRYMTTTCNLDSYTMIGADKFENIFVSRVPKSAEEDFENNPNNYKFQWENGYLNGSPFKMEQVCNFYVGEIVTSIVKTSMMSSEKEIILYSTINGGINALFPFDNQQNYAFFTHLEIMVNQILKNTTGIDSMNFRSHYSPCKGIIDGDKCELYAKLSFDDQLSIAQEMSLTPNDIHKKLEEIRRQLI